MAKRRKFEVVFKNGWVARELGGERAIVGMLETKAQAVAVARKYAREHQPSQLFIKGRNGRIQDERTYGQDPRRTKG